MVAQVMMSGWVITIMCLLSLLEQPVLELYLLIKYLQVSVV